MTTTRAKPQSQRSLLRLLCSGLLFASAATFAAAQGTAPAPAGSDTDSSKKKDDDTVVLDTLEVTGSFAGSLAAAAELKQAAPTITEVIAAEDIGKLPDVSIADSIARLP